MSTDDSKVLDPPETPGPVFAIRAFKSALFGTPAAEGEDAEQSAIARRQVNRLQRRKSIDASTVEQPSDDLKGDRKEEDPETANQAALSPTKSILVTPGTTSNRRKTVSFGDTILHSDTKKDHAPPKASNTTFPAPGSVTGQWMSGQSDGKPRSKFTQSLLDAREQGTRESPVGTAPSKKEKTSPQKTHEKNLVSSKEEAKNDETLNLDDPRSGSGKYWKSEFESYRQKTNLEMRKLIQYRSAAKSYARKKDAEALRLTQKLREGEEKVTDMERHVTGLVSNMVGGAVDMDKEKLVQDLARQTALAVQYKHKVDTLRKTLERHGVVGNQDEQPETEDASKEAESDLRRLREALDKANAKIEEMKPHGDLKKLQDLAQSSERKASELEKENASLKQTLARVKQEMNKYEGRRKDKEAKLKQREVKLETRNQEYREKLKEYRESEDALKRAFREERILYHEKIESLKSKIANMEYSFPAEQVHEAAYGHRKEYPGVQTHDFGVQQGLAMNYAGDLLQLGNLSPTRRRSNTTYAHTDHDHGLQDSRRNYRGTTMPGHDEEPLIYFEESPNRPSHRRSHTFPHENDTALLPSSPPALAGMTEKRSTRTFMSPRPTLINFSSHAAERPEEPRIRHRRPQQRQIPKDMPASQQPTFGSLPSLQSRAGSAGKRDSKTLSPDRAAAAKARLKQKEESRRKGEGKENIRDLVI
jgi:hypothetical protein